MYPLVKDKLKETEKRIRKNIYESNSIFYICQKCCQEYYGVLRPMILNSLPICPECWDKKQNEKTISEN